MLHESARVIPNGCRSHSTMAIPSVSQLPPLMGGMLFVCSAPHLPHAVHRTTRRSSTDTGREPHYSARVLDFDSLALSMSSGHRPFHGHPLLFMGVRGRTEVRNLNRQWWAYCFSSSRLLSAGCRGGACICTVGTVRGGSLQRGRRLSCVWGRAVRASNLLPVQFKKLSQTVRPFIRECILYYGVYNSGFVCKSGPIHLPGPTQTKSRTSMKLVQASRVPLT